jgi:SEC-C motif-containing protein
MPKACPCGLPQTYDDCCGRFHAGSATAPTAELLMRSRYSAFAVGDANYLTATWHPDTRPSHLELDSDRRWTGLQILGTTAGGLFDTAGTVEFRASYRLGSRDRAQHENSRFAREAGQWRYVDGVTRA